MDKQTIKGFQQSELIYYVNQELQELRGSPNEGREKM